MNLIKLEKQYPCTTIAQAMEVKSESFASMVKANTERFGLEKAKERVETTISLYIAELNQSLNLKRQMSEQDMIECAMLIRSEYYYLQIHHIAFIFRQAKLGEYGEFYESINTPKIMTWFKDFANAYQLKGAEKAQNEHKEIKREEMRPDTIGLAPRFAEALKSVVKQPDKDEQAELVRVEYAAYNADPEIVIFKDRMKQMQSDGCDREQCDLLICEYGEYRRANYPNL